MSQNPNFYIKNYYYFLKYGIITIGKYKKVKRKKRRI